MQKNVLIRIGIWICISVAAVVGLIVLATRTYQMAGQKQESELVKGATYSSKTHTEWVWTKFKDGSGFGINQKEGSYCLRQDVGEEKDILVHIRPIEYISDESRKYVIEVYWDKDESPFQIILTESVAVGYNSF